MLKILASVKKTVFKPLHGANYNDLPIKWVKSTNELELSAVFVI